jgi:hypothetical protein
MGTLSKNFGIGWHQVLGNTRQTMTIYKQAREGLTSLEREKGEERTDRMKQGFHEVKCQWQYLVLI